MRNGVQLVQASSSTNQRIEARKNFGWRGRIRLFVQRRFYEDSKKFCLALCVLSANIGTAHAAFIDGVNLGGGFMWNDSVRPRFDSAGGIALHTSVHFNLPGPFILAPFYDISFASPMMQTLGTSLNYAIGMRDFEPTSYFLDRVLDSYYPMVFLSVL